MADTAWHDDVLRLKAEGKQSAEIAEIVGKHAATVRKVIARAREEANEPDPFVQQEPDVAEGQTTVDEQIANLCEHGQQRNECEACFMDEGHEIIPGYDKPEFVAEAGEAVGPMPPREPEDTEPEMDSRLSGTRQMALDFGPNADIPVGGTLVIKSDKLASGFFGLGDVISGTFTARIVDAGGKERLQRASGEFRAQPQHHVALITELVVKPSGPAG